MSPMAKIYYKLIIANPSIWTIEKVPALWREDVRKLIDAEKN